MTRPNWDEYFLVIAKAVALRADCSRRAVGCVLVDSRNRIISTGYNGAPAGDPGCLSGACPRGQLSYDEVAALSSYDMGAGTCISVHAEANALLYAPRIEPGTRAYITFQPCPTCFKLLRAAGINEIYVAQPEES